MIVRVRNGFAAVEHDLVIAAVFGERQRVGAARDEKLGAEAAGPARARGSRARRPIRRREAEVILDARRRARLSSRRLALDEQRRQSFRCAVHGRRQARRTRAHDDDVVRMPCAVSSGDSSPSARSRKAGVVEAPAVGQRDQRIALVRVRRRLGEVVPFENDVVAAQEVADAMARDVEAMPLDDHRLRRRGRLRELLQALHATRHRADELACEHAAFGEHRAEVRRVELRHARGLLRAQARDGGGPEQQRDLAEIHAGTVLVEAALDAVHHLEELERSLEEEEERRLLAFVDQPVAGPQVDVGEARRHGARLAVRKVAEQRDLAQVVDGDQCDGFG